MYPRRHGRKKRGCDYESWTLEEMSEIRSMDVLLPTLETTLRLRVVSTAFKALKVLLYRLKLPLPNRPQMIQDVVQTLAVSKR